jgi:hypothetical protein
MTGAASPREWVAARRTLSVFERIAVTTTSSFASTRASARAHKPFPLARGVALCSSFLYLACTTWNSGAGLKPRGMSELGRWAKLYRLTELAERLATELATILPETRSAATPSIRLKRN